MSSSTIYQPGKLVRFRDRRWMVLPSDDPELILLKPLGGSDHEITGVFYPLLDLPGEKIKDDTFPKPDTDTLGDFETAKLLFDATRLSFRNASGPFRCMGKLSFRPRSYQVVPLVLALKQKITRLLIADDVGIGKTIEALVILKELLERGDIKRFAVVCPPHLCEQWHKEVDDKLDIQAEIIRSSTVARLERKLPDDRSVFYHFPYQVISIDYIKSDKNRNIFIDNCPEMVIVDEAHTCTLPAGSKSRTQQQRYHLIHDISKKENQHLLLLTATPHSGKNEEFQSLLGLLKAEFETWQLDKIDQNQRKIIADYFIQRKREAIIKWAGQETKFPHRDSAEIPYNLSNDYKELYFHALNFARGLTQTGKTMKGSRVRYWAALALLRGIMSSPACGLGMLKNRQQKYMEDADDLEQMDNPVIESLEGEADDSQQELINYASFSKTELEEIQSLTAKLEGLQSLSKDHKAKKALEIIRQWVKEGVRPIVFCRFIATAKYLGEVFKTELPDKYTVRVITSEFDDEQRKIEVDILGKEKLPVMIATDCLSEGINLQDNFNAVLHYDLPWNPNRIEQRDGRVDRFGQKATEVKTYILWGEDNPIDAIVLNILIKKIKTIQKNIGVSIPIGEDNKSIMDAVLREVLLDPRNQQRALQGKLDFGEDFIAETDRRITHELEEAKEKAIQIRNIFTHSSVKQEEIEAQLKEVDEAIGDVKSVEKFVVASLRHLQVTPHFDGIGYEFNPVNLPVHLRFFFEGEKVVRISFESPTPRGYRYIGRNNPFTEQLCQFITALALDDHEKYHKVARSSVIRTKAVTIKTTLIQFRVRNVIRESGTRQEVVSEEMYLWGYEGSHESGKKLDYAEAKKLLLEAQTDSNITTEFQKQNILDELDVFRSMETQFTALAEKRAGNLVEAHGRFRHLVGGRSYEKVYPILPPDLMGIYILLPPVKTL